MKTMNTSLGWVQQKKKVCAMLQDDHDTTRHLLGLGFLRFKVKSECVRVKTSNSG